MNEKMFLKRVRALLIYYKIINIKTILHKESWLSYHESGYKPIEAVKEDMEGYITLARPKWSEVHNIFLAL